MPRHPRIDFPGARHHVMNRGARRVPVFENDETKAMFLELLADLPARFSVELHGYVIMPNHYHLLVRTPRANLSQFMRHLGAAFTLRLNAQRDWDGPVFRGRFKNQVAGDSRYWLHLLAYLHLNPVPSLVARPEDWPWSSHRAYLGLETPSPSLHTGPFLELFGDSAALATYCEEHMEGRGTLPDDWDARRLWVPSASTVSAVGAVPSDSRPRLAAEAIREVVQVTGGSEETLLRNRRGRRDNRGRWLVAWWLGRRASLSQREIGRHMNCNAGNVANMLQRLRARRASRTDAELEGWIESLEGLRRKGLSG